MRRAMGLETEHGTCFTKKGIFGASATLDNLRDDPQYTLPTVSAPCKEQHFSRRFWKNGSQVYVDLNTHLELAGPECSSSRELALYDAAGSLNLGEISKKHLARIYKNNMDSLDNTFGCHENYLVASPAKSDNSSIETALHEILAPFFATRILFAGSGLFREDRLLMSQRASRTHAVVKDANNNPGLFHSRIHTSHCDQGFRFHVTAGDSNMEEYATYMKTGTTALLLTVFEHEQIPEANAPNPIELLHDLSKSAQNLISGDLNSVLRHAFAIQEHYLKIATLFFHRHPELADAQDRDILKRWAGILYQLPRQPLNLETHIDWICKARIMHEVGPDTASLEKADLLYHLLDADGLYYACKNRMRSHLFSAQEVGRARVTPPMTRAHLRTKILTEMHGKARLASATWRSLHYRVNTTTGSTTWYVNMPDPLSSVYMYPKTEQVQGDNVEQ